PARLRPFAADNGPHVGHRQGEHRPLRAWRGAAESRRQTSCILRKVNSRMVPLQAPQSLQSLVHTLFESYRVVDLSEALSPGVLKADGHYWWSQTARRYELRQWISPGGHFQHFVDAASQVGTHVETPAHIVEGARQPDGSTISPADVPL